MEILHVRFEVLGQLVDARGQQCDLDFRRAGIALRTLVVANDLSLPIGRDGHL
jgi:hypothetical protein